MRTVSERSRDRTPSPSLRFAVFNRDGFRCIYCGRSPADGALLVADHVIAWSEGGLTVLENLVTACEDCNTGKRATGLTAKIDFMAPIQAGAICVTRLRVAAIGHVLGIRSYRAAADYLAGLSPHVHQPPRSRMDRQVWDLVAADAECRAQRAVIGMLEPLTRS